MIVASKTTKSNPKIPHSGFPPRPEANLTPFPSSCCDNRRAKRRKKERSGSRVDLVTRDRRRHRLHPWKKGATWRARGRRKCREAEPKLRPEVAGHVTGATRDIVRRHNKPLSSSSSQVFSLSLSLRRRREERRWFMTGFEAIASNRPPSSPPILGLRLRELLASLWDSALELKSYSRLFSPFVIFIIFARRDFLELTYFERSYNLARS